MPAPAPPQAPALPQTPAPPLAIVTGAASGIGYALASRLLAGGYRVAAVDCDGQQLRQATDRLGPLAMTLPMDVSDRTAWRALIEQLRGEHGRLDLLVNNAGVLTGGELREADPADTQRVLDVNLRGTLLGCQAAASWLIESGERAPHRSRLPLPGVINIASIFAVLAPPGFAAYSASKAGVVALSESLRGELAPHGLNVTVALPGTTPTRLFSRAVFTTRRFADVVDHHQRASRLTADLVAGGVLDAASRGRAYAVIGGRAKRLAWLKRLSPVVTLRRVADEARRELGLPPPAPPTEN